ncbi:winged helix DNA-binding domain-containing protein [Tenggerimyces flavus]|uniref:Winged helix DNA-binding domain-containing protein n=1 Tax=Tenggerimyces flavus TaxID=1708749 RepID=A0ABV7YD45_9ACTN|nr:winged helix DNA-binding domain-containing protein [Tenggerimyces flavus]MBM7788137.1 hypothetical protein [Tenggerimyces flavus]
MTVTARALNRATLARQLLLERSTLPVADAVRQIVGIQAQQPASPYVALWNRLSGFDPTDLDAAFAELRVVRSTLMRMTLHAVHADDYPTFREAVDPGLRASRLDSRYTISGLSPADADALTPELLAFVAQPRTAAECARWLERRFERELHEGAWWGVRSYAPMLRAPTGAPWQFNAKVSYVAPPARPTVGDAGVSAESLKVLLQRYLAGFGPASIADMAQFTLVPRTRVKAAVRELELEPVTDVLYDVPDAPRPDERTPAPPRLMAMWDSILFAYADRSRVISPEYRKHVTRVNGDTLPTLLVDGYVAGVWRAVDGGIEATAFHPLPAKVWKGLETEAGGLLALLSEREPRVYSFYERWWSQLPHAEVRVLGG